MAHQLTFEQIQSCKKVFDSKKILYNDDTEDAKMDFSRLKQAIDAIGELRHKVTEEECLDIQKTMNLGDEIDFPTFLRIAAIKFKKQEFTDALIESFKSFDKSNKGHFGLDELKSILTDFGPKISMDEADKLLSDLGLNDNDNFDYKDFVNDNI